ncbi:MAG: hypothetical protein J3R72DRAFT_140313 [Linnemannia gamsii]|nr:MAG: hypothetical protein J3R72DRAFT_140313 [Linnemannia gamsii]
MMDMRVHSLHYALFFPLSLFFLSFVNANANARKEQLKGRWMRKTKEEMKPGKERTRARTTAGTRTRRGRRKSFPVQGT